MEYIPVLDENHLIANDVNDCELSPQSLPNNDGWDFCISSVNKKSLPTATWWIVCQNIDVWCAYPAQDKLKDFFSLLIQSSLSSSKNNFSVSGEHVPDKHGHMKTIRPHQISVELVSNAALYEQSVLYIAWITWRKTLIGCGLSWSRFEKSYFSYTTMPRVLS